MNANARTARRTMKARSNETRATRRAVKAVATGTPQPAKTQMIVAGIDTSTAKRYVAAFSRGVTPTVVSETEIKLKGRRTKTVPVKLYDRSTFTARLAVYRPKDSSAAAVFARAAHRLAA
jgi:hypothetical protein